MAIYNGTKVLSVVRTETITTDKADNIFLDSGDSVQEGFDAHTLKINKLDDSVITLTEEMLEVKSALYGTILAVEKNTYDNVGVAVIDKANGYPIVDNQKAQVVSVKGNTEVKAVMATVDLGTLNWGYDSNSQRFYTSGIGTLIKLPSSQSEKGNIICGKYTNVDFNTFSTQNIDNAITLFTNGNIYLRDTSYTDVATFKEAMSGVMLTYETNENEIVSTKVSKIITRSQYASVDLGTLNWAYDSTNKFFSTQINDIVVPASVSSLGNYLINGFTNGTQNDVQTDTSKDKMFFATVSKYIGIRDLRYTDTTTLKEALSGVILYYEPINTMNAEILTEVNIPLVELNGVGSAQDELTETQTTRVIDKVDLGTLDWRVRSDLASVFYAYISNLKQPTTNEERLEGILSSKYGVSKIAGINENMSDKSMLRYENAIYIKDTTYTDVATFKQAMSGTILYYELATPTFEENGIGEVLLNVENGGTIATDSNADITLAHVVYKPLGE